MKSSDVTCTIEFRTHCRKCGTPWSIQSILNVPHQDQFGYYVEKMMTDLEKAPRECCGKKLNEIGKEWSKLFWPESFLNPKMFKSKHPDATDGGE